MPRKASRRQRRHGDLPAGFRWRDGRPRWEPSPTRRAEGWRGTDLKDGWRRWLDKGEAIKRAEAIAAAVAGWAAGEPVPPSLLELAPKGAGAGRQLAAEGPRSIGALIDGFLADPKPGRAPLADKTKADYRSKLAALVATIAAANQISAEALRAIDVDLLLPPPFGSDKPFLLADAYDAMTLTRGAHMAHGVLAAASAWLAWVMKKKRALALNPAQLVERSTPDGRIVIFEWAELRAMVAAAEWLGLTSIADAIILAVDLSWAQQDLLALTWGQLSDDGHVKHRRIKTGVAGNPPLLAPGRERMAKIRARWHNQPVRPTHILVCELTGQRWAADTFRHCFALVREAASAEAGPAILGKHFRDLRDTAITYGQDAGLTIEQICTRSLHDPERARAVISKHYGALGQDLADGAAEKLEAHYARMGYTFDAPAPAKGG